MSRRNRGNSTHEAVLRGIHGIRRHMAAWSIADKVILCLSAAALVVAIAEWIMNPPHTVVGTLLAVLLCLILAFNAMEVAYGGMVHDFCWRNRRFTGRR